MKILIVSENCCWQSQTAYQIGDTFSSAINPDTGINTTLRCAKTSSGPPHIVVDVSSEDTAGLEITNDKIKEVKDLLLTVLHIIQPAPGKYFYHDLSYHIVFLCVFISKDGGGMGCNLTNGPHYY